MNPTSSGSRSKPPNFQLYKALHGIFKKYRENPKRKHKIH